MSFLRTNVSRNWDDEVVMSDGGIRKLICLFNTRFVVQNLTSSSAALR